MLCPITCALMTSNSNMQASADGESATPANTQKIGRLWCGIVLFVLALLAAGCRDSPGDGERQAEGSRDKTSEASTHGADRQVPRREIFVDVARTAGIDFVHFNGMSGEFYILEVKCVGCGLLDYDNDGDLDVYMVQGAMLGENKTLADAIFPPKGPLPPKDRLYRNDLVVGPDGRRTLKFTDVTDASGIMATGFGIGVAAGDYDNDGFVDLHVAGFGRNYMYRNNGDGTFTDVTEKTGTGDTRCNTAAAFVDYDHDGYLDLYVCAYSNFSYSTHKDCRDAVGRLYWCGPRSYKAVSDRLYRNRGDGTFEDVTTAARILPKKFGTGLGVVCADFNGDGWIDLYITNDALPNHLWMNKGDGTFANNALLAGCAVNHAGAPEAGMGVDAGDYDNDGDEDLFMTHLIKESNTIYVNDGTGLFDDRTRETGLATPSVPYTAFGTGWLDYDNDGYLDILVANGEVTPIEEQVRAGDRFPLRLPNQLYRNMGDGKLAEVTKSAGKVFGLLEVSRGAAFGDIDNDGDTDVLITNNSGSPRLLINQVGNRNHWIGLRMVDSAKKRDMIGTWVGVFRSKRPTLWRRVRTSASYCSTNDPRVLVGLGDATEVTRITAKWPDGSVEQWTGLPVDKYTTLARGSGKVITQARDRSGKRPR